MWFNLHGWRKMRNRTRIIISTFFIILAFLVYGVDLYINRHIGLSDIIIQIGKIALFIGVGSILSIGIAYSLIRIQKK